MKRTGKLINAGGVPMMTPNDITNETADFYISYNNVDRSLYGSDTTALVTEHPTKFLILNGNHTKQYNDIISNGGCYEDCMEYFKKNESLKSKYSDNWYELMIVEDGRYIIIKDDRYV